jgi:hypothetical protein
LGAQYDGLITNESADINVNWDEKWYVASRVVEDGWIAEFDFPLRMLRIQPNEVQTWGIDFERIILRKNERTYWNNYSRDFQFVQVSQAGHLIDLKNLVKGKAWRIKPFGVTGFHDDSRLDDTENLTEVGLENLTYRVTPGLTAQVTINTDFAQTDVDDQRINLDRFSLFFPEKREFFLEGLGNFSVGARLQDDPADQTVRLFHSRRIGLSDRGEAIPIIGGGRFTGRSGPYTIGALQMWTDDFDSPFSGHTPAESFTVMRVKRDILERSYIGGFFSNRDSDFRTNRVAAFDSEFIFFEHLNASAFAAKSDTTGVDDDELSLTGRMFWDSDRFTLGGGHLVSQANFLPDLGFLPREDFKKSLFDAAWKPRPGWPGVRQLTFRSLFEYFTNNDNVVQTKNNEYSFVSDFESSDRLRVIGSTRFERVLETFDVGGIDVFPGDYPGKRFNVEYTAARDRFITGDPLVEYLHDWGFFGSDRDVLRLRPVFRISDKATFRPSYEINNIRFPHDKVTIHVLNSRVDYSFSNRWLTSFILQHNSVDHITGFNLRLNCIYRVGDNFFIIWNRVNNESDPRLEFEQNGLILKFTRSWDF